MDLKGQIDRWRDDGVVTAQQAEAMRQSARPLEQSGALGLYGVAGLANGLALFLFGFLYDVPVATHQTLLLWMGSLVPLLYVSRSRVLASLLGLVFVCWLPLFAVREAGVAALAASSVFPLVFLLGGILLFAVGGLHYLAPALAGVARGLRIVALVTVTLALFVLGLSYWAGRGSGPLLVAFGPSLAGSALALGACAAAATVAAMLARPWAPKVTRLEGPISLGLVAVALVWFWVPLPDVVYLAGFNLLAVAMLLALLTTGWARADLRAVDIAGIGLLAFALTRWVDLLYRKLTFAPFFGGGAALLVVLAGTLAVKRGRVAEAARRGAPAPAPAAAPAEQRT